MSSKRIRYLTELDVARLEKCAAEPGAAPARQAMLDELLEHAVIVEPREVAANVVTMNSQVTLVNERDGKTLTYTVAYPHDANVDAGRRSRDAEDRAHPVPARSLERFHAVSSAHAASRA